MPLTSKGRKIKSAMSKQYGKKKGEQVFYASKNKGKISGVDRRGTNDARHKLAAMVHDAQDKPLELLMDKIMGRVAGKPPASYNSTRDLQTPEERAAKTTARQTQSTYAKAKNVQRQHPVGSPQHTAATQRVGEARQQRAVAHRNYANIGGAAAHQTLRRIGGSRDARTRDEVFGPNKSGIGIEKDVPHGWVKMPDKVAPASWPKGTNAEFADAVGRMMARRRTRDFDMNGSGGISEPSTGKVGKEAPEWVKMPGKPNGTSKDAVYGANSRSGIEQGEGGVGAESWVGGRKNSTGYRLNTDRWRHFFKGAIRDALGRGLTMNDALKHVRKSVKDAGTVMHPSGMSTPAPQTIQQPTTTTSTGSSGTY
jgi:hypothetical protein